MTIEELKITIEEYKIIIEALKRKVNRQETGLKNKAILNNKIMLLEQTIEEVFEQENLQFGVSSYLLSVIKDNHRLRLKSWEEYKSLIGGLK